jgi:predicted dehydrogenase
MRIGLIGCGNVVLKGHLPAIQSVAGLEIIAAADPTGERRVAVGDLAGLSASSCYADWRDLVARTDIDAVVIATPPRFRTEIALAAAEAGKHLLCEKPISIAPVDACRMVDAAQRHGVVLATVHNYLCVPVYRQLKTLIDDGVIGQLEIATLNFLGVIDGAGTAAYRPGWRHDVQTAGGGVLMDMLHVVYLAGWFFDASPVRVSASIDRRAEHGGTVEDLALVRYRYPDGQAMVNVAWGHGPGGIELTGTHGRIVLVNEGFGTLPFVAPEYIHIVNEDGTRVVPAEQGNGESLASIHRNFRDAVALGSAPIASGKDGGEILEAVVGAYASAALAQELALPLNRQHPVFLHGARGITDFNLPEESVVRRRGLFGAGVRVQD